MKKYLFINFLVLFFSCSVEKEMVESWKCGTGTVKDIDGNEYQTVEISSQCWMKENLKVSRYANGTVIPLDDSGGPSGKGAGETWSSRVTGARTVYNHSPETAKTFGFLYNWFAVSDPKGLCPAGWRVPTDNDWNLLVSNLGGEAIAGGKLKSTTTWLPPNLGATNSSGFSAIPAGGRPDHGGFDFIGELAGFWTSTESRADQAFYRLLNLNGPEINRYDFGPKKLGLSVRCIKE
ncbi:MAG: fibrobacter succinogenes major paralogous domain-containing protein [Saprospiraceae bacterium]